MKVNKETGEIRQLRAEADAGLHFEGTGETAWGTKWVIVAVRSTDVHGRVILDVEWVPKAGGEATSAMDSITNLAPLCPGAQGVIYDTALRGIRHQRLLRDLGLLPVNKAAAAKAPTKPARRTGGPRVPKSTHIEDRTIDLADGSTRSISLLAKDGALGIGALTDTGERVFTELRRVRTQRYSDKSGHCWYNTYELPDLLGGGIVKVRLHGGATTLSPSTGHSTTRCGCAGHTRSATSVSTSTCSPTHWWSTAWRCTATGSAAATCRSPRPPEPTGSARSGGFGASGRSSSAGSDTEAA